MVIPFGGNFSLELHFASICVNFKLFVKGKRVSHPTILLIVNKVFFSDSVLLDITLVKY